MTLIRHSYDTHRYTRARFLTRHTPQPSRGREYFQGPVHSHASVINSLRHLVDCCSSVSHPLSVTLLLACLIAH